MARIDIMSHHPYIDLPSQAFWKTAVAGLDPRHVNLQWHPKFPISRETRIITVGSCFAQHISASLKDNGFCWLDSEPPPATMSHAESTKNGYGIFSFRTGNIYTAALFKQWIWWATEKTKQSEEAFQHGDRYYDPFRPSINEKGFESIDAVLAARKYTLRMIRETVQDADLLIFTLGLTEAWLNKDGTIYPMCPGTVRGEFSPNDHRFHNYTGREVELDLIETFDELAVMNPKLRFLLTVSPVPLTATASGEHVLTATTYSKSVLRSVAGSLAKTRDDTDYFPAFELITAPIFRARWYDTNMRSVSTEGVAHVMDQFMQAVEAPKWTGLNVANVHPAMRDPLTSTHSGPNDICDDIILESWLQERKGSTQRPQDILVLGDSHMAMVASALEKECACHVGGAIMNRSDWHAGRFDVDKHNIFRPHNPEQNDRWCELFQTNVVPIRNDKDRHWLVTNIGIHTTESIGDRGLFAYMKQVHQGENLTQITLDELHAYLMVSRRKHLAVLARLLAEGFTVIVVTDPPTEPYFQELFESTDAFYCELYESIGCLTFSAREWIKSIGGMPTHFRSTEINEATGQLDWIHGSPDYYQQLIKKIVHDFRIPIRHET